ncbi:MAG: hypothetical protein JSR55_02815 [Proteobacteria bacterium]|nr:hypothetical protein [Pseudomonadota bacterium]
MKSIFKTSLAASALLGAATWLSAPAQARTDFIISIGVPNAVQYDYGSGGYCDSYGCPDSYWDFPIWYGPVYWRGTWYRGPVYYRDEFGRRQYWIAGGWHHDQWRGPRPDWWDRGRYYAGPALGYDYYRGHGFHHDRDHHWHGDNWRSDHHDYNGGNGGLSVIFGDGDHHDRHDRDGRDDRNGHDWNNNRGDGHDNHGGDNWHGRDNHGMATTMMSPGAAYNASTGGYPGGTGYGGPAGSSPPATPGNGSWRHDHGGASGGGDHHDHSGSNGSSSSPNGNIDDHRHDRDH